MKNEAVILGAGRPFSGSVPSSERQVDRAESVLSWQLDTLTDTCERVQFVAGYGFDRLKNTDQRVHFSLNSEWSRTGAVGSLLRSDLSVNKAYTVLYSDILFRKQAVSRLISDDNSISVAVDRTNPRSTRVDREIVHFSPDGQLEHFSTGPHSADECTAALVGLVHFPLSQVPRLNEDDKKILRQLSGSHLGALLEQLRIDGAPIRLVDFSDQWTSLDDDFALAKFIFGTKAETLSRLEERLVSAKILAQISFTVSDWTNKPDDIYALIRDRFPEELLAVRSSALAEDTFGASNAGKFLSLLSVPNTKTDVEKAVNDVINSYDEDASNQILVQPMIDNAIASGVLLSRSLSDGGPYYTVNYTLGSATDSVTRGADRSRVAYVHRSMRVIPAEPSFLGKLINTTNEIEKLVAMGSVDIEFAVGVDNEIFILQVRPLAISHDRRISDDLLIYNELETAVETFEAEQAKQNSTLGNNALFGVMPDWNPAEIIGLVPRPLATSLYRHLILDEMWAIQRHEMGYRDMRSKPLLKVFSGHPYVDVRASINSFIPSSLPTTLAARLANAALSRLSENPHLHDKIEFDVIPTCIDFNFNRWSETLFEPSGFTPDDIDLVKRCYSDVTNCAISSYNRQLDRISQYEKNFRDFLENRTETSKLTEKQSLLELSVIMKECKTEGVLPFAHLARDAFIAMSFIRSASSASLLSAERTEEFLSSVHTISHDLQHDAHAVASGQLSLEDLVLKFGHLRPGTYDILSMSYRDTPELYLAPLISEMPFSNDIRPPQFQFESIEAKTIVTELEKLKINVSFLEFADFLIRAIQGREYAKFVFTRTVSWVIDQLVALGERSGLTRDDLSYLSIQDILDTTNGNVRDLAALSHRIAHNSERFKTSSAISLPPLITSKSDFFGFVMPRMQANYIGKGRHNAHLCVLDELPNGSAPNKGDIVLVRSADPGYEWLFSYGIGGLITAFGGANSHMAIRCAEFGIPAAIGVGENTYRDLARTKFVSLDCSTKTIFQS